MYKLFCEVNEMFNKLGFQLYTIREYKGKIDGTSIVVMGDLKYGRTVHSLIKFLSLYENVKIYGLEIKGLELPDSYKDFMKKRNVKYISCNKLTDVPSDVDFIYQTRVQQERLEDENLYLKAELKYLKKLRVVVQASKNQ